MELWKHWKLNLLNNMWKIHTCTTTADFTNCGTAKFKSSIFHKKIFRYTQQNSKLLVQSLKSNHTMAPYSRDVVFGLQKRSLKTKYHQLVSHLVNASCFITSRSCDVLKTIFVVFSVSRPQHLENKTSCLHP